MLNVFKKDKCNVLLSVVLKLRVGYVSLLKICTYDF